MVRPHSGHFSSVHLTPRSWGIFLPHPAQTQKPPEPNPPPLFRPRPPPEEPIPPPPPRPPLIPLPPGMTPPYFHVEKISGLVFVGGFGDPFLENLDLFLQYRQFSGQIGSIVSRVDIESRCWVLVESPTATEAPASSISEPVSKSHSAVPPKTISSAVTSSASRGSVR